MMLDADKVRKVARILSTKEIDAFLLGPSTDLEYVSGLKMAECERFKGMFILANGDVFCVVPHIYLEEFEKELPESTPVYVWEDQDWFYPELAKAFRDYGLEGKQLAVNDGVRAVDAVEIQERHDMQLVNGWHLLDDMRIKKNSEEVELLRHAGEIADATLEDLLSFIRPGMTEKQIRKQLLELFEEHGAQGLSFDPIVARGPNASMAHYNRTDGVLQERDSLLIDFGCRYRGYCSDMTRTFFLGEPSEEERRLYEIVRRSQEAGEEAVRPGVPAEEVDRAARKVIEDAGYGEYFNNRVGHGIGMAVHEAPFIMEGNKRLLEPGMSFSIEPGIYIPGRIGIRIENIVVVTDGGCRPMNVFPRELTVIGDSVSADSETGR
jgi:Xaa-Pro aminopeptidase